MKEHMKDMRIILLVVLAALAVSSAWSEDDKVVGKELALLQGEWSLASAMNDGEPMPDNLRKQMKWSFKGDVATRTMSGKPLMKAKITIDPSKMPKTIDHQITDAIFGGGTQLGIYELDGNTLKVCLSYNGGERPKEFSGKLLLMVWKREKAAAPAPHQK
jgi:uncharacterized protein (TIGR03067 family)